MVWDYPGSTDKYVQYIGIQEIVPVVNRAPNWAHLVLLIQKILCMFCMNPWDWKGSKYRLREWSELMNGPLQIKIRRIGN